MGIQWHVPGARFVGTVARSRCTVAQARAGCPSASTGRLPKRGAAAESILLPGLTKVFRSLVFLLLTLLTILL